MSPKTYRFITSTEQLLEFPDAQPVCVSFTSLLTKIKYTGSNFLLEFNDFDHIEPERRTSYVTKIRCKHGESSRLAKISVSLLCRYFDIDAHNRSSKMNPTLREEDELNDLYIDNVHLKVLCFARCDGIYLLKDIKSSIFLDDITPISLTQSVDVAREYYEKQQGSDRTLMKVESGTARANENGKSILRILRNLVRENGDPKSEFKFKNLVNTNNSLTALVKRLEMEVSTNVPKKAIIDLKYNPLFLPSVLVRSGYASNLGPRDSFASQNEFNSQLMSTQQPDYPVYLSSQSQRSDSEGSVTHTDPMEPTDSRKAHNATSLPFFSSKKADGSEFERIKRQRLDLTQRNEDLIDDIVGNDECSIPVESKYTKWDPIAFIFGDMGSTFRVVGRVAAINNLAGKGESKLYIINDDTFLRTKESVITLIPLLNCLEVIHTEPLALSECYQFEIIRSRWDFKGSSNYSWRFFVKSYNVLDIGSHGDKNRPVSASNGQGAKHNGLKKIALELSATPATDNGADSEEKSITLFQDLVLDLNKPKYITMIGLFVSCSFEHPTYVTMVFTDFTKNGNLPQKYLFDRYILRNDIKLDLDNGYRVIMYNNFFQEFNRKITDLFRGINGTNGTLGIRELRDYNSENISQRGIVCKLGLKAQYFRGKLNLIVRNCVPVVRGDAGLQGWGAANRDKLAGFYRRTATYINDNNLTSTYVVDSSSKFFPFRLRTRNGVSEIVLKSDGKNVISGPESCDNGISEENDHSEDESDDDDDDDDDKERRLVNSPRNSVSVESQIPDLNAELSELDVINYDCSVNIGMLNFVKLIDNTIYTLGKVKLLEYVYYREEKTLEFLVTNDLVSSDFIDPSRILKIYIIGARNLRYFLNKSEMAEGSRTATPSSDENSIAELPMQEMEELIGGQFGFKLKRGSLRLNRENRAPAASLLVWCPIELTLEELQYQLRYLSLSDSVVKAEEV